MSVYLVARNEGNLPVYRQIRDVLVSEIHELYKPGDSLPAEKVLAARFGVNRHTLRRAVDELVSDGFVERHHGKGVFILETTINYSIGRTTRFTETLQSQGRNTTSQVLRKQVIPSRGTISSRLKIMNGENVIFIETLRTVDSKPFCVISHFIPFASFPDVFKNYDNGSLHEFINTHYGIELKREQSLVSAILPESTDASLLNMPRQMPVLRVKSLNLDAVSSKPIEYAVTRFRGDATQLSIKP